MSAALTVTRVRRPLHKASFMPPFPILTVRCFAPIYKLDIRFAFDEKKELQLPGYIMK